MAGAYWSHASGQSPEALVSKEVAAANASDHAGTQSKTPDDGENGSDGRLMETDGDWKAIAGGTTSARARTLSNVVDERPSDH